MRFSIVDRGDDNSKRVAETLKKKCIDIGWEYDDEKSEVIFSVGGDGTLLRAIHTYIAVSYTHLTLPTILLV